MLSGWFGFANIGSSNLFWYIYLHIVIAMPDRHLIFLLCIILFAAACKKENNANSAMGKTFTKQKINSTGSLRVFATSGEIIDINIKSNFTQNYDAMFEQVIANAWTSANYPDSFIFTGLNSCSVFIQYGGIHPSADLIRDGNNFVIRIRELTEGVSYFNPFSKTFGYLILQYPPQIYDETLFSSTNGIYQFSYNTYAVYVLKKYASVWTAPFFVYYYQNNSGGGKMGINNNIIKNDFYKNLPLGDTVVLKTAQVTYQIN
jgi:hypothetical protein